MKKYNVFYRQQEDKFWWGVYWAMSATDAINQARDDAGKQPSGSGGPHRESVFTAEEAKQ